MARNSLPGADLLGLKFTNPRNKGRFQPNYSQIEADWQRLGKELQDHVVSEFEKSLSKTRAQRPTNYTVHALASPEALKTSRHGFVYLWDGYMATTPAALYWRGLEGGTRVHVGQPIRFFRSIEGKISVPQSGVESDTYLQAPKSRSRKPTKNGLRQYRNPKGLPTIHRPIQAHNYIRSGRTAWTAGVPAQMDAVLRRFFNGIINGGETSKTSSS